MALCYVVSILITLFYGHLREESDLYRLLERVPKITQYILCSLVCVRCINSWKGNKSPRVRRLSCLLKRICVKCDVNQCPSSVAIELHIVKITNLMLK